MLQAVNRLGTARYVDIANATQIPYPTVCRIVETLIEMGMVEKQRNTRYFRPTFMVQSLSNGYQEDDALITAAGEPMAALCDEVGWPITIATRVGASMVIRDSTHHQTTLTYNHYAPGYALPLLECSVGKAYLAFCGEKELSTICSTLKKLQNDTGPARLLLNDPDAFLGQFRQLGYAFHTYIEHSKNPGKTSSLSVPIVINGQARAAMGLVYFSSTMNTQTAADRYLDQMRESVAKITQRCAQSSCAQINSPFA